MGRASVCTRCQFFPVHKVHGYATVGLCLRALMRNEDCRRCVPSKHRKREPRG